MTSADRYDKGLLAVDLGVRSGMALFGHDGRLKWYRSRNFGSTARLRRAVAATLRELSGEVALIAVEGPRPLADIWQREAERRSIAVQRLMAETWRSQLLWRRQQRSGALAKQHADRLARQVIDWSGAARPTSLRHDAAEAILIGLWAVLEQGWLAVDELPLELRQIATR